MCTPISDAVHGKLSPSNAFFKSRGFAGNGFNPQAMINAKITGRKSYVDREAERMSQPKAKARSKPAGLGIAGRG